MEALLMKMVGHWLKYQSGLIPRLLFIVHVYGLGMRLRISIYICSACRRSNISLRSISLQFSVLDGRIQELEPALRDILNSLLDPRLFSVDRGELHILLHQSKSLSEFHSLVKDIEGTLTDMLDTEEDMADMYLTHLATTG